VITAVIFLCLLSRLQSTQRPEQLQQRYPSTHVKELLALSLFSIIQINLELDRGAVALSVILGGSNE